MFDAHTVKPPTLSTLVLYRIYSRLVRLLRYNRSLHRIIFGYLPICDGRIYGEYWDWTTLQMIRCMGKYLHHDSVLLDMGCGPVAPLAIYAARKLKCRAVTAVDYLPEIAACAQKQIDRLGLAINCCCSDLFSNITNKFDCIVFNSPYIMTPTGRELGLFFSDTQVRRFCGGDNHPETIVRFLRSVPHYLSPGGRILLGVNRFYMPDEALRGLFAQADAVLHAVHENAITKSAVYVLSYTDDKERK